MMKFIKIADPPVQPDIKQDNSQAQLMYLKDEFRLTQNPVPIESWQSILSEMEFNKQNLQMELSNLETNYNATVKGYEDQSIDERLVQALKSEIEQISFKVESEEQISCELEQKLTDTKRQLLHFKKFIYDQQATYTRYEQKHQIISEQSDEMVLLKKNLQYEIYRGGQLIKKEARYYNHNLEKIKNERETIKEQIQNDVKVFQSINQLSQLQQQVLSEQKKEISELDLYKEQRIKERYQQNDIIDQINCLRQLIELFAINGTDLAVLGYDRETTEKSNSTPMNKKQQPKTASMVKSEFFKQLKRAQTQQFIYSKPTQPQSGSQVEKDKQIEDFYQFCGQNLETFLNQILKFYNQEKLKQYNLSEQFDNLNLQKNVIKRLQKILEGELNEVTERYERTLFLEKHSLQPSVDKKPQSASSLELDRYQRRVDYIYSMTFRLFIFLNQNIRRWSMMMIEVNHLSSEKADVTYTIDQVDPNNPFQMGYKAYYTQAINNTSWLRSENEDDNFLEQMKHQLEAFYVKLGLNSRRNEKLIPHNEKNTRKFLGDIKGDFIFYNFVDQAEIMDKLNKFASNLKVTLAYDESMEEDKYEHIYRELFQHMITITSELKTVAQQKLFQVFRESIDILKNLIKQINKDITTTKVLNQTHPGYQEMLRSQSLTYSRNRTKEKTGRHKRVKSIKETLLKMSRTQKSFFENNRIFNQVNQRKQQRIIQNKCREYESYYNPKKTYEEKRKLLPLIHTSIAKVMDTTSQEDHKELEYQTVMWQNLRSGGDKETPKLPPKVQQKNYMSMSLRKQKLELEMKEFTQMQKALENTLKLVPQTARELSAPVKAESFEQHVNQFAKKFSIKIEKKSTENLLQKIRQTYTTMNTIKSSFKMKSKGSGYGQELRNSVISHPSESLQPLTARYSQPTTRTTSTHL